MWFAEDRRVCACDLFDALSDRELGEVGVHSHSLKKKRDEERKQKAMDEARAILAAAGLDFRM